MPTTNPIPSTDPSDLLFNAGKLDEVVNGTANSFTDRLGVSRRTVVGMNADFDAQLADAESDLNVYRADAAASAAEALGYLQTIRATSYGAYASDPATDPLGNPPTVGDEYFNTTANLLKRWNGTTWQASDINTANLAASSGSSLVGYDGGTVQDVLDGAKSLQDYDALRAYIGRATRVYITGLLVTSKPSGIAGVFQHDPTDTSSLDNNGTVIVLADGRRFKRDYDGAVHAKWFELVGAGLSYDETTKIQNAVNAAAGRSIYFQKPESFYNVTSPINVASNFTEICAESTGTIIKNTGSGVCFNVTGSYVQFRKIAIWGNGGAYGVGATGSHGIHFNGARNWVLDGVNIRYHGGNGVHCNNGVWVCSITNSEISQNFGDGINSVSPSGASLDQNGNAFSIVNSAVFANTGNGVNWKASALNINGNTIEQNKKHGILIDCTGKTNSAFGINISGNYTENNVLGEMKFISVTGTIVDGLSITGNYMYSIQSGPLAMITFSGPARSNRSAFIAGNSIVPGGTVVNLVDGGNSLREDCTIIPGAYSVINANNARVIQGIKTRTLFGATDQTGITWADITQPSANFFSASNVDTYFKVDIAEGDLILDFKFYVTSNTTTQYTVSAYLYEQDVTTGAAGVSLFSTGLNSDAGGGNKLFTFTPLVSSLPVKAANNKKYYLRLRFSPPTSGTTIQMYDPVLRYV